eukprot:g14501.t1
MWCSSALWVIYGLFIWDIVPTVATNVVGLVFSMYYCAVFATVVEPASRKRSTYNLFAGTFLVICLVVTFCLGSFSPHPGLRSISSDKDANSADAEGDERAKRFLGLAASAATAVQYAAPLTELVKVVNRRSTDGLSLLLAAVSLICSSLWACYGVMLGDPFIYVPNVMGVLFSATQCSLFWVFPRKATSASSKHSKHDRGDPHKGAV